MLSRLQPPLIHSWSFSSFPDSTLLLSTVDLSVPFQAPAFSYPHLLFHFLSRLQLPLIHSWSSSSCAGSSLPLSKLDLPVPFLASASSLHLQLPSRLQPHLSTLNLLFLFQAPASSYPHLLSRLQPPLIHNDLQVPFQAPAFPYPHKTNLFFSSLLWASAVLISALLFSVSRSFCNLFLFFTLKKQHCIAGSLGVRTSNLFLLFGTYIIIVSSRFLRWMSFTFLHNYT